MILEDIRAFSSTVPSGRPLLGLDLGTKTIGLALSDRLWRVATPLLTLKRKKFGLDSAALLEVVATHDVGGLVLGLPLNMDGSEGPRCQATRAFARNLLGVANVPITLWDERLSTVAAERALLEADTTRRRRTEVIDHVAAGFILQGCLDRIAYMRGGDV
ncbi:MAG: Holliday junction resolvase RuvX [Pseudomonadota bacterium]